MRLNNSNLRQIFVSNLNKNIPNSRTECPSPKELLLLFRAKKSEKKKTKIIDHITNCYHCAHEFEFILKALRFEKDMNQVAKKYIETKKTKVLTSRFSWRFASMVAGISVICISITAFIISNTYENSKYRASTPLQIDLFLPEETKVPKSFLSFKWENVKDSEYYAFELYDETLYQIWKSEKLFKSNFTLQKDVVAMLEVNKSYFWMVTAFFPNGRKIESQLKEILLIE